MSSFIHNNLKQNKNPLDSCRVFQREDMMDIDPNDLLLDRKNNCQAPSLTNNMLRFADLEKMDEDLYADTDLGNF